MPVNNIVSTWSGGDLYFYEKSVGRSATGDVFIIGDDAITIGGTSQDIDFKWYATGSKSFVLDAGAGTLTISGIDVTLTGDFALDTEDINLGDGDDMEFGDSQDVLMRFSLGDESNPTFVLALDDTSQQMHITDKGAVATDWSRSAGTHPEVAIHSNTTPATDYLAIGNHDGSIAHIDVVGGTTLSLDIAGTAEVLVTASATTPATSDSNALGSATLMWSDLFLASGAVINFNNGNATITHSTGLLTLGSAGLSVGASGAGFDVIFYGDTADCNFFWDQNGDTNGSLSLGATGGGKGVDFTAYGNSNGSTFRWDQSADCMIATNASMNVTSGRTAQFMGTIANGNLGDGYGAVEAQLTITGTAAGQVTGLSNWINMNASSSGGSNKIIAQDNGIWAASTGTPMASAIGIIGMRMQYVAEGGENPGALHLFDTNIYANVLTSLFRVNAIGDMGGSTGAQTGNDYKIPLFYDQTAGQLWYINIYHS